jgi:hypothetical protein
MLRGSDFADGAGEWHKVVQSPHFATLLLFGPQNDPTQFSVQ